VDYKRNEVLETTKLKEKANQSSCLKKLQIKFMTGFEHPVEQMPLKKLAFASEKLRKQTDCPALLVDSKKSESSLE